MSDKIHVSDTNKIKRSPKRAVYDREVVYAILDAVHVCHMGVIHDNKPVVIPMLHWRKNNMLYIHGASNGRLMLSGENNNICVTVTSFDGYVLARSAFNHSANYRSVVIHGCAEPVECNEEKTELLKHFMDIHFPGRWEQLRPIKDKELNATSLLKLPIENVAAKVRAEGAGDETDDPDWRIWTGVLPVSSRYEAPIADPCAEHMTIPDYLNTV